MKVSMTKVKAYILKIITGYEGALEDKTEAEKVQGLFDAFYSEYSFRIKQVGLQNAIRDWLQGLPSVIGIDYFESSIEALTIHWGND